MDYYTYIPTLLCWAWLVPLASFAILFVFGKQLCENKPVTGGYVAASAIVISGVLSFTSLFFWVGRHFPEYDPHFGAHHEEHASLPANGADLAIAAALESQAPQAAKATPVDRAEFALSLGDCLDDDATAGETKPVEAHKPEGESEKTEGDTEKANEHAPSGAANHEESGQTHQDAAHDDGHSDKDDHGKKYLAGEYYLLGSFGSLRLSIGYYIDALTITMFCMVTLIASCIHFYAMGYMHDEEQDVTDHEVTLSDGSHLSRPGRFFRFFQFLSLFCFSMLGIVLAGNIAMVFIFWELVGICSYFLIGFYVERQSASTAANKAFIVNRVGDFGMIIGLMALWTSLGTFAFGDVDGRDGIFSLVRPASTHHALQTPDGMVRLSAQEKVLEVVAEMDRGVSRDERRAEIDKHIDGWRTDEEGRPSYGYWLLIIAGAGIFCGCVGKSAQFPLHTWLPDAMEGPTPVSALVHSATMVAAGVYLVARFYPVFTPEVLLLIAISGCITLFVGATIAITATDIKRVLAYSTISQLGYMMLALGVGGWIAGVMHLITHAFFKSLLFMCSGSVIHAVHTNEMTEMGGLRKKMPITAYTMLVGCLAIAGAGVPFLVGFSGYYSKDKILEQAYSFASANSLGLSSIFFLAAAGGAAITAFYMFRLWFMTFAGEPRNAHRYDHAHESPPVMAYPLIVLAVFAIAVAWGPAEALLAGGIALVAAAALFSKVYNWTPVAAYPIVIVATLVVWIVLGSAVLQPEHRSTHEKTARVQMQLLADVVQEHVKTHGETPHDWSQLLASADAESAKQLNELQYQGVAIVCDLNLRNSAKRNAIVAYQASVPRIDGWAAMADGTVRDLMSGEFSEMMKNQTVSHGKPKVAQFYWYRVWAGLKHFGVILSNYAAQILVTMLAGIITAVLVGRSQLSSEKARQYGFVIGGIGACILLVTGLWGAWGQPLMLEGLLQQAYPEGALLGADANYFAWMQWNWPSEPKSHDYAVPITLLAFGTAVGGFTLAALMYGMGYLNADDVRRQFAAVHHFLRNKWWFDELYDLVFVQPCHLISRFISSIDRVVIDRFLDWLAWAVRAFSNLWELVADRIVVDGFVNAMAGWVRELGLSLRNLQTGKLRQYVMFIAIGAIVLFLLITVFLNPASLAQG